MSTVCIYIYLEDISRPLFLEALTSFSMILKGAWPCGFPGTVTGKKKLNNFGFESVFLYSRPSKPWCLNDRFAILGYWSGSRIQMVNIGVNWIWVVPSPLFEDTPSCCNDSWPISKINLYLCSAEQHHPIWWCSEPWKIPVLMWAFNWFFLFLDV